MTSVEFLKENHGVINMALCIAIIVLLVWILMLEMAEHSNSFASTGTRYKEGICGLPGTVDNPYSMSALAQCATRQDTISIGKFNQVGSGRYSDPADEDLSARDWTNRNLSEYAFDRP